MSETTPPGPQSQPSPQTEPSPESEPGRPEKSKSAFSRPRVRLGAIVAIAIAAGFVVWLLVDSGDDTSSSTQTTATGAGVRPGRALGVGAGGPLHHVSNSRSTGPGRRTATPTR